MPRTSEMFGYLAADSFNSDGWGVYLFNHSFLQSMALVLCLELDIFS